MKDPEMNGNKRNPDLNWRNMHRTQNNAMLRTGIVTRMICYKHQRLN
jgi:hypothetical protein